MYRSFLTGIALIWVFCAAAQAADPAIAAEPALPDTTRGQHVTVRGENLAGATKVYLRSGQEKDKNDRGLEALAAVAQDGKNLTFPLKPDMPTGRYLVFVEIAGKESPVPGELRVLPDAQAPVRVDSIYRLTEYRRPHGRFDFEIAGQNLGRLAEDNIVEVVGRGPIPMERRADCDPGAADRHQLPCVRVDEGTATRRLQVIGFQPGDYEGLVKIQVRVGPNVSEPKPITFSRISEWGVRLAAVVAFLVLALIIGRLVAKGVGSHKIQDRKYGPWTSFFLDKQTNTYSLSKFQLVLWTAAAVLAYIYLFLCRTLVQWQFSFPPIPDNLPGLLAISAGTTVVAAGVTASRGSKGSGRIHPSMADFITTGGLVVGERFQFFIWTLVGAMAFVSLLFLQDPATVRDLPTVPETFVYLMGISSAGYLGGKLARKPGPVIKLISIEPIALSSPPSATTELTIHVQGENLAEDATVQIDDHVLRADEFEIKPKARQTDAPDPAFCAELDVILKDASAYLEGEHTLALVNKDRQAASIHFPLDALKIESVAPVPSGAALVQVKVSGKNFADGMTAEWKDAQGRLSGAHVSKNTAAEAEVSLLPGPPGKGKLTLISAIGLRAAADVTVT